MGANYTLILVDGKRMSTRETQTNGSTGTDQSWVPPLQAIERIEVVRGPMSSLYGSDAMGGVVNIITRKVPEKWGGSVRLDSTLQSHSRSGNLYRHFYLQAAEGEMLGQPLGLIASGRGQVEQGYTSYQPGLTARFSLSPIVTTILRARAARPPGLHLYRSKTLPPGDETSGAEIQRELIRGSLGPVGFGTSDSSAA